MLCFDEWLRKDTYWADHNAEVTKAIVSRLIAKLMHLSKKYILTLKSTVLNYPKLMIRNIVFTSACLCGLGLEGPCVSVNSNFCLIDLF